MNKFYKLPIILLVVILLLSPTHRAFAFDYTVYYNFSGVTDATALKDVWYVNSSSWNAHVRSYSVKPVYNIGTIGWTWWTFRDTCDGVIIDNWVQGGYAEYNDADAWDTGVDDRDYCGGTYYGWSIGNHDFKHSTSTWRPYVPTHESV
jgi:hypothetical protein